jgi:urease accessory protein UreF
VFGRPIWADKGQGEQRASIAQGKGFLAAAGAAFADVAVLARDIKGAHGLRGHLAPIFGVVCRALRLSLDETARLFLFIALRSLLSAAVRSVCLSVHLSVCLSVFPLPHPSSKLSSRARVRLDAQACA